MIRRRQNSGGEETNSTRWLTTFNDLVTLLMVFFVLLFTMSTVDTRKMQEFQLHVVVSIEKSATHFAESN